MDSAVSRRAARRVRLSLRCRWSRPPPPPTLTVPCPRGPGLTGSWAAASCPPRSPCSRASRASASRPSSCSWWSACRPPGSRACSCPARSPTPRSRRAPGASGIDGDAVAFAPGGTSRRCSRRPRAERPVPAGRATRSRRSATPAATQMPGGSVPGPAVHGRARRARQGGGHRGPADRARHEGRRPGRAAHARARRRRGARVRRRPPVGPADALGGQEPVRRRGRDRLVRDAGRRACARSTPRACWLPGDRRARRGHGAAAGGAARPRRRGPGARGGPEGPARRQATGLDARRFQLVAAVLDRAGGSPLGRAELFGASSGGMRVDDPACDLAVAAALASAAPGCRPPPGLAVRRRGRADGARSGPRPAWRQRLSAARGGRRARPCCAPTRPRRARGHPGSISVRGLRGRPRMGAPHVRNGQRHRLTSALRPSAQGPVPGRTSPLTCGFGLRCEGLPCYPAD